MSKFKPKRRKAAVKRIKLSTPKNSKKPKILVCRINNNHRLIRKSGERKLKASRYTSANKCHDKYINFIS